MRGKDLVINHLDLMQEWDIEANRALGFDPHRLVVGSGKKAWWICKECGHRWQTQIFVRRNGHGCPRCAHTRIGKKNARVKCENQRLTVVFPDVTKIWNYEKNSREPKNFTANSNKNVWWTCIECGKEWQSSIYERVKSHKLTCRRCSQRNSNRNYLQQGVNDLETLNPKVAAEWDLQLNFDVTPSDVTAHSSKCFWWRCKNGHSWKASILSRTKGGYRGCPYCANRKILPGNNDLATTNPQLVSEWNYEKNTTLQPSQITTSSNRKVWWKCSRGHEWESSPNNRRRTGCPYCANQKVLSGYNDLATVNPILTKEWDYDRNQPLLPNEIIAGSTKRVWWICRNNHSWQAKVSDRNEGHNCPYCTNREILVGYNDLVTTNPELAQEWDTRKNVLSPQDVVAGSAKIVWWRCKNGHEWKASIVSRNKGHFCPVCDATKHTSISEKAIVFYLKKLGIVLEENKRIERKELDIYIPSLKLGIEYDGQYFHRNPNKDLAKNALCDKLGLKLVRIREPGLPQLYSTSHDIRIESLNGKGYDYLNDPIMELLLYLKVPIDDDFKVNVNEDLGAIYNIFQTTDVAKSIATTHPRIADEWDSNKNSIPLHKITKGTHFKAWWICKKCNHHWQAMVYSRCSGSGCPKCSGRLNCKKPAKLSVGKNDLATIHPEIVAEWDFARNTIQPNNITCGSNLKVWWLCKHQHSYLASIANRIKGTGCPYCANRIVLPGYNDLATTHPHIAEEWNYIKNKPLLPTQVSSGSGRKVWWKCSRCGREWESSIYSRKREHCAECNRRKK